MARPKMKVPTFSNLFKLAEDDTTSVDGHSNTSRLSRRSSTTSSMSRSASTVETYRYRNGEIVADSEPRDVLASREERPLTLNPGGQFGTQPSLGLANVHVGSDPVGHVQPISNSHKSGGSGWRPASGSTGSTQPPPLTPAQSSIKSFESASPKMGMEMKFPHPHMYVNGLRSKQPSTTPASTVSGRMESMTERAMRTQDIPRSDGTVCTDLDEYGPRITRQQAIAQSYRQPSTMPHSSSVSSKSGKSKLKIPTFSNLVRVQQPQSQLSSSPAPPSMMPPPPPPGPPVVSAKSSARDLRDSGFDESNRLSRTSTNTTHRASPSLAPAPFEPERRESLRSQRSVASMRSMQSMSTSTTRSGAAGAERKHVVLKQKSSKALNWGDEPALPTFRIGDVPKTVLPPLPPSPTIQQGSGLGRRPSAATTNSAGSMPSPGLRLGMGLESFPGVPIVKDRTVIRRKNSLGLNKNLPPAPVAPPPPVGLPPTPRGPPPPPSTGIPGPPVSVAPPIFVEDVRMLRGRQRSLPREESQVRTQPVMTQQVGEVKRTYVAVDESPTLGHAELDLGGLGAGERIGDALLDDMLEELMLLDDEYALAHEQLHKASTTARVLVEEPLPMQIPVPVTPRKVGRIGVGIGSFGGELVPDTPRSIKRRSERTQRRDLEALERELEMM
ncbi:hypothetical protein SAICODRAFT_70942 [Saitoella complicata NRRL Y-17804]|uniref:uncharacterized protein n=1 Tax=Saitoella complicata (strain BCRC 22490 / CBS 7301 / JCM 7358 / NBRC 10748 / NRRL Y-17804) TaxID=698492 RepID=UPI000867B62C|nr:uncharacterized protein SAICODRAFT_70942 [Saitoella complicata NRRL Y-17804]ODQ53350.1 hypothetical protein SAICODRAFT_70942 [Saitoella complicata NRRL Y-17804]